VWTHKGCVCNERVALAARHQVDDGARFDKTKGNVIYKYLKKMSVGKIKPKSQEQILEWYSGAKRRQFEAARDSLRRDEFDPKVDGRVSMFLKADKYHDPEVKAPRCIQFRNKRYCLRLARFLNPIEHAVYQILDDNDTRVIAKARNSEERAADLWKKWQSFSDPIALCCDHSKFDAHVGRELLEAEHRFYLDSIRKVDGKQELKELLKCQLVNKGITRNGTKFVTVATRMSGDMNTGLGNSVLNTAMLNSWLGEAKVHGSVYVDGDDSVVIVERTDLYKLSLDWFERFGMRTKVEIADEFELVEFCQSRPIWNGRSYRMIRNPLRVLARLPWVTRKFAPHMVPQYLASVGRCELALGSGYPVLQYIGNSLAALSDAKTMRSLDVFYAARRERFGPDRAILRPVTPEARNSFARAWGISVAEQLRLEACTVALETTGTDELIQHVVRPFL